MSRERFACCWIFVWIIQKSLVDCLRVLSFDIFFYLAYSLWFEMPWRSRDATVIGWWNKKLCNIKSTMSYAKKDQSVNRWVLISTIIVFYWFPSFIRVFIYLSFAYHSPLKWFLKCCFFFRLRYLYCHIPQTQFLIFLYGRPFNHITVLILGRISPRGAPRCRTNEIFIV